MTQLTLDPVRAGPEQRKDDGETDKRHKSQGPDASPDRMLILPPLNWSTLKYVFGQQGGPRRRES
jgi:hypothetical protein